MLFRSFSSLAAVRAVVFRQAASRVALLDPLSRRTLTAPLPSRHRAHSAGEAARESFYGCRVTSHLSRSKPSPRASRRGTTRAHGADITAASDALTPPRRDAAARLGAPVPGASSPRSVLRSSFGERSVERVRRGTGHRALSVAADDAGATSRSALESSRPRCSRALAAERSPRRRPRRPGLRSRSEVSRLRFVG